MAINSALLMTQCQIALGITQRQMGELVGKDRRTIQRWQAHGCLLLLQEDAAALANALRPLRPDLADQVLELRREVASLISATAATPEAIDDILQAAAAAAGSDSPEAVRAVVTAAFVKAAEGGFDLKAIVAGLTG